MGEWGDYWYRADGSPRAWIADHAQITTEEQLDEYPDGTRLLDFHASRILTLSSPYLDDRGWGLFPIRDAIEQFGPLAVIWDPAGSSHA